MSVTPGLQLTLGPLLYYWTRDQVFDFYERAAAWPVRTIYIGETVCTKRHELRLVDWQEIGRKLADRGKEVVFSTPELIESEADLRTLRKIAANGEFRVEANDIGSVRLLAGKVPFVAGPYLNIYSRPTLEFYRGLGASRWVMPIEVGRDGLAAILEPGDLGMETEVFSFGRLPLAISARCFTARYNDLHKDECAFRCLEHPDGLTVTTQDNDLFLTMNGLQTQSARVYDLARELPAMARLGVNLARVSPQSTHTDLVVKTLDAVLRGALEPAAAVAELGRLAPAPLCNGYWHGRPGQELVQ